MFTPEFWNELKGLIPSLATSNYEKQVQILVEKSLGDKCQESLHRLFQVFKLLLKHEVAIESIITSSDLLVYFRTFWNNKQI